MCGVPGNALSSVDADKTVGRAVFNYIVDNPQKSKQMDAFIDQIYDVPMDQSDRESMGGLINTLGGKVTKDSKTHLKAISIVCISFLSQILNLMSKTDLKQQVKIAKLMQPMQPNERYEGNLEETLAHLIHQMCRPIIGANTNE